MEVTEVVTGLREVCAAGVPTTQEEWDTQMERMQHLATDSPKNWVDQLPDTLVDEVQQMLVEMAVITITMREMVWRRRDGWN